MTSAAATATAELATKGRTNLFVWARTCISSNLAVDYSPTKEELVQLLVGMCVTVSNVSYTGATLSRGTFTNGICSGLPIDSGVMLSSGNITNALGPNNDTGFTASQITYIDEMGTAGDGDLDSLVGGGPTHDAAVLEFDVMSPSNSTTITFEYSFASEEYPEWIASPGSGFNDIMAIFVSTNQMGTNWIIASSNNIALVPGTNQPVTINTINGGGTNHNTGIYVSPTNPQYYQSNEPPVLNIQYDGLTVLLTANAHISAGISHRIKISIADYLDAHYDATVFIKAASPCP